MSKPTKPNRLTARRPIKLLSPNAKLAPYHVPDIPPGKFQAVPGQRRWTSTAMTRTL
jgi:hypothetical protein